MLTVVVTVTVLGWPLPFPPAGALGAGVTAAHWVLVLSPLVMVATGTRDSKVSVSQGVLSAGLEAPGALPLGVVEGVGAGPLPLPLPLPLGPLGAGPLPLPLPLPLGPLGAGPLPLPLPFPPGAEGLLVAGGAGAHEVLVLSPLVMVATGMRDSKVSVSQGVVSAGLEPLPLGVAEALGAG